MNTARFFQLNSPKWYRVCGLCFHMINCVTDVDIIRDLEEQVQNTPSTIKIGIMPICIICQTHIQSQKITLEIIEAFLKISFLFRLLFTLYLLGKIDIEEGIYCHKFCNLIFHSYNFTTFKVVGSHILAGMPKTLCPLYNSQITCQYQSLPGYQGEIKCTVNFF